MASKVLVVGSGAIGLRTALELLRRRVPVLLRSARPPLDPSTCSMGAGGLWMPYHCDDGRVDRWAIETLDELLRISSSSGGGGGGGDDSGGGGGGGDAPLVEIVPAVVLKRDHGGPTVEHFIRERNDDGGNAAEEDAAARGGGGGADDGGRRSEDVRTDEDDDGPLPAWTADPRLSFQHLTVEMLRWQNHVHGLRLPPFSELASAGYRHAWLFRPPVVDAPRMLESMLREVEGHPLTEDADVDAGRRYRSLEEMVEDAERSGCDGLVNCTGLGARELCSDPSVTGGRGVLLHYDRRTAVRRKANPDGGDPPQPNDCAILTEEPPWGSETETCYVIPRGDTLCVGGTYLEGDDETGVREGERRRLEENARRAGIDTERCKPAGEWTGFRPCRPEVRLEADEEAGRGAGGSGAGGGKVRVVHNYGHGGSGWTVFVGAAREAAALVLEER